jgi:hypothetical protein
VEKKERIFEDWNKNKMEAQTLRIKAEEEEQEKQEQSRISKQKRINMDTFIDQQETSRQKEK